jgi:hypothetical protein
MTPRTLSRPVALDRGDVLRIRHGRSVTVRPESGVLWVTEERMPGDVFVGPGEMCRLEGMGLALLYAHRASRVVIDVPANANRKLDVRLAVHGADDARPIRFALRRRGLTSALRALWRRLLRVRESIRGAVPVGGFYEHDRFLSSRRVRGGERERVSAPGGAFDRLLMPYT